MTNVRPPDQNPQESAVQIVATALRVLQTRDRIEISDAQIDERARAVVTSLGAGFDLVAVSR